MYIPPLDSLLRALGVDRATYERGSTVALPKDLFVLLMKLALESCEFNQAGYLKENPDVAEGVRKGDVPDPREHYIADGYFEGRTGGTPTVDEAWYLRTYTDIAQAVKQGKINSAREHYNIMGSAEGRSPNAANVPVAEKWKKVLVRG